MRLTPYLCVFLSSVLAVAPLPGQTAGTLAATPALIPAPAASGLAQVRVIENDGAQASIGSRSIKGMTVSVTDAAGEPVSDAAVSVRLPESGSTGTFADGTHSAIAYTDASGRALINGIQWSATAGPVSIRVTATKGTSHAGVLLEKTLTQPLAAPAPVSPADTLDHPNTMDPLQEMPPAPPYAPPVAQLPVSPLPVTPIAVTKTGATGLAEPGTPAHPQLPSASTAQAQPPSVSITTTGATGYHPHHSNKKWVIAALVAAGAAGGAMAMMHGKGAAPAAAVAPLSIGTPSISIGHP